MIAAVLILGIFYSEKLKEVDVGGDVRFSFDNDKSGESCNLESLISFMLNQRNRLQKYRHIHLN